jgi:DNA modification methylase
VVPRAGEGISPDGDRSVTWADWDDELLELEIADLKALDFDLALTGFDTLELDRLAGSLDEEAIEATPELPEKATSHLGDLWMLGDHRLLCGDATSPEAVQKLLGKLKPGLMVTDPPYGVEYDPKWRAQSGVNRSKSKLGQVQNDDRADWSKAWTLFPGNVLFVWHAGKFASTVQTSIEASGFEIRSQIIWAKDRFALSRGNYHWQHEPCWYAVRDSGGWTGDRSQSTLWSIKAREDSGHGHGTQKPVECMRRPIVNNSSPGQLIYDPFLGSGTTLVAAEATGRICCGLELDPKYVDVVIQRWQTLSGKEATLDGTTRTFAQVAKKRAKETP